MKRAVITYALVLTVLSGLALPAFATPPVGACPPAFELKSAAFFGPGFQEFLLERVDKNGDEQVCAQHLPEAMPFPNINFVDNVVRLSN